MNKIFLGGWLFMVLSSMAMGCADSDCANQKCVEAPAYDFGASRVLVYDTASGELLWGVDLRGEQVTIVDVRDSGGQLVLEMNDACWQEPATMAFSVDDGLEVPVADESTEPTDFCANVVGPGDEKSTLGDGVCIYFDEADGQWVAVDAVGQENLWQLDSWDGTLVPFEDAIILKREVVIDGSPKVRISRVAALTGQEIWFHQQAADLALIGTSAQNLFMIDEKVTALSLVQGDVVWQDSPDGWWYDVATDGGAVLDGKLYVTHQEAPPSPCQQ